jgi:hypothetical protein
VRRHEQIEAFAGERQLLTQQRQHGWSVCRSVHLQARNAKTRVALRARIQQRAELRTQALVGVALGRSRGFQHLHCAHARPAREEHRARGTACARELREEGEVLLQLHLREARVGAATHAHPAERVAL